IDPGGDRVEVIGRGGVTVRRRGHSVVVPAGTTLTLTELRGLARHGAALSVARQPVVAAAVSASTVSEVAADCERRFDSALDARDADAMVRCILELEATIHAWSTDTEM